MTLSHSPNLPYGFRVIARIAPAVSAPAMLLSFALNNDLLARRLTDGRRGLVLDGQEASGLVHAPAPSVRRTEVMRLTCMFSAVR